MSKPSRNEPCPCGSGRKHKNCCGKLTRNVENLGDRIHRADFRLRQETVRWVVRTHGKEFLERAWTDFSLGILKRDELDDGTAAHLDEFSMQWWLHRGWLSEDSERSPVMEYLAASGVAEDVFESRFAQAAASDPPSFYRVCGIDPGRTLSLEEFFTGEKREVREDLTPPDSNRGCFVYAHLAGVDGLTVLLGAGPFALGSGDSHWLEESRDFLEEEYGADLNRKALRLFEDEIRSEYLDFMRLLLHPVPPNNEDAGSPKSVLIGG